MGLDQYAYIKFQPEYEHWLFLAEWRKHPNLQGWMERLWRKKVNSTEPYEKDTFIDDGFNGIELALTMEDILKLEQDIKDECLDGGFGTTTGFFFGDKADDEYKWRDLTFCDRAKVALNNNHTVYYNSSW
jgi:hypothetical protein